MGQRGGGQQAHVHRRKSQAAQHPVGGQQDAPAHAARPPEHAAQQGEQAQDEQGGRRPPPPYPAEQAVRFQGRITRKRQGKHPRRGYKEVHAPHPGHPIPARAGTEPAGIRFFALNVSLRRHTAEDHTRFVPLKPGQQAEIQLLQPPALRGLPVQPLLGRRIVQGIVGKQAPCSAHGASSFITRSISDAWRQMRSYSAKRARSPSGVRR